LHYSKIGIKLNCPDGVIDVLCDFHYTTDNLLFVAAENTQLQFPVYYWLEAAPFGSRHAALCSARLQDFR